MKKEKKENKNDNNELKEMIENTIKESMLVDSVIDSQQIKDVETVKIIINELLGVKKHLPSTTNLTTRQVHGLTKLITINSIFKSPLINLYINNIEELKRSETTEPFSMLKGFFELANNQSIKIEDENNGIFQKILGKKGVR